MVPLESNTELAWRASNADVEAYGHLVRQFERMALGFCFSQLNDWASAEDAAQEAFLEAFRCLPKLRDHAAFPGWLRAILFKQCDRIRRAKRFDTVPIDEVNETIDDAQCPAYSVEREALRVAVRTALAQLPEAQRTAMLLFYIESQPQKDIAAFLDVPIQTVKNRLYAGRTRLKEILMVNLENFEDDPTGVETTLADRVTGLIKAAQTGDIGQVQQLLRQVPGISRQKSEGATALHFASWFAHPEVARLLILNGADLNLRDETHHSPPIGWAHESGQHEMVEFLLELGAQINISQAAGLGKREIVEAMLAEDPELLHFQGGWGTPLHEACGWGHTALVKWLLSKGADPSIKNRHGETPLDVTLKQKDGAPCTPYLPDEERREIARAAVEIEALLTAAPTSS